MTTNPASDFNPYQTTASDLAINQQTGDVEPDRASVRQMASLQRFTSIASLAFTIIIGLYLVALFGFGGGGFVSLLLIFFLFCSIVPTVLLWHASTATSNYARNGNEFDFERFVVGQLRFWRAAAITSGLVVGSLMLLAVALLYFAMAWTV
ncbi:MAG: hypothetical protein WBD20_08400 [Pirellulaceae bacterium]